MRIVNLFFLHSKDSADVSKEIFAFHITLLRTQVGGRLCRVTVDDSCLLWICCHSRKFKFKSHTLLCSANELHFALSDEFNLLVPEQLE